MRVLCLVLAVAVALCLLHEASANTHKIALFVAKAVAMKVLKSPVIPLVLPLPIIKHKPKPVVHHEIINVHEPPKVIHKPVIVKEEVQHHGWDEGWDNKW